MSDYLKQAVEPATQREQADPRQVPNNAGGFTFVVDDWSRLRRFLILGAEGGTYYAGERKLVRENAAVVERLAKSDGLRLVREVVELSESGRAPKNDPAILALAIAAKQGDDATRTAAYAAVPRVCRIGTHLYHFAEFVNSMGGWGRGARRSISRWFNDRSVDDLALQLVKYQQRDGWSARDLMRLAHPKPATEAHDAIYKWATSGYDAVLEVQAIVPPMIEAFEELKVATDSKRILELISKYRLPREAVPTQHLTRVDVWEALLPHMGLTALVRNLATMTRIGLIAPLGEHVAAICARVTDAEQLKKARVHPIQMLSALRTYAQGHGERGGNTWTPVQAVVDALDAGFYVSFASVEPTNKATLLALDVSGSMTSGVIAGCPGLTPRVASAAMALVTAAVEPNHHIVGFATGSGRSMHAGYGSMIVDVPISAKMRLDDVIRAIERIPMGGTDCALPMIWAGGMKMKVDAFAIYTDNETWAGDIHPHVALRSYRKASGIDARVAVVGLTATAFTIADPTDAGMMDFVGFDAGAPSLMSDFFAGR
jgi:60 kDa SS-A/Ro ribonucleoprotein